MATEATLRREVPADPASIALLLAGPSGVELWPGVEAKRTDRGWLSVTVEVPGRGRLSAAVRSGPPLRAVPAARPPGHFWFHFDVAVADLPALGGTVVVEPLGRGRVRGSSITLRLRCAPDRSEILTRLAEEFLANLCRVAASRSRAA